MLKISSILLLILLLGCNKKEGNQKKTDKSMNPKSKIMNSKNNLSTQELMLLPKTEAIEKFGTPSYLEKFTMDDAQEEFRNVISDKYTEKERQSESILIEEVTWEKDKDTWITVWYEVKQEKLVPKGVYSWKKGTEF